MLLAKGFVIDYKSHRALTLLLQRLMTASAAPVVCAWCVCVCMSVCACVLSLGFPGQVMADEIELKAIIQAFHLSFMPKYQLDAQMLA